MHVILLLGIACCFAAEEYQFPHPKFNLLQPKGFSVSIPDEHGIQLFAFHGNVNKELQEQGAGQISGDIITKTRGKWVYTNKKLKVREGDVMNYWMFVIKNGRGHIGKAQSYTWKAEDFKKIGRKSLYHNIGKRHAHWNFGQYNLDDDGNGYVDRNPEPFRMRTHKFPSNNPYGDYNSQKPWSHHGRGYETRGFHHDHHHHFNHDHHHHFNHDHHHHFNHDHNHHFNNEYNSQKSLPYHGRGYKTRGFHHNHQHHCNHEFSNDSDSEEERTHDFYKTETVPKSTSATPTTVKRATTTTPIPPTTSATIPSTTSITKTKTTTFPLIDVRFKSL